MVERYDHQEEESHRTSRALSHGQRSWQETRIWQSRAMFFGTLQNALDYYSPQPIGTEVVLPSSEQPRGKDNGRLARYKLTEILPTLNQVLPLSVVEWVSTNLYPALTSSADMSQKPQLP